MSRLGEDVMSPMALINIQESLMFSACDCRVQGRCGVSVVNGLDPNFHANSSMTPIANVALC